MGVRFEGADVMAQHRHDLVDRGALCPALTENLQKRRRVEGLAQGWLVHDGGNYTDRTELSTCVCRSSARPRARRPGLRNRRPGIYFGFDFWLVGRRITSPENVRTATSVPPPFSSIFF